MPRSITMHYLSFGLLRANQDEPFVFVVQQVSPLLSRFLVDLGSI